jgi:hypothetical protein
VLNELELLNWLEEQEVEAVNVENDQFYTGAACAYGSVINYIKARRED